MHILLWVHKGVQEGLPGRDGTGVAISVVPITILSHPDHDKFLNWSSYPSSLVTVYLVYLACSNVLCKYWFTERIKVRAQK